MKRRSSPGFTVALVTVALGVLARVAAAQEVGTIVGVEGTAEIGRAGTWVPATIGAVLQPGDELRTGRPGGRMSVVLTDDSVLNIGEGSDLKVVELLFDPTRGVVRSLVRLLAGKIRPLVSPHYKEVGGTYQIETGTAVVGARGTEFVVAYDPVAEVSEVVGVTGQVEVHGTIDRVGRGVLVTRQELTTVAKGKLPTAPQKLSDKLFRQYIEGLEFIGGGRPESVIATNPLLAGATVPAEDRAPMRLGPTAAELSTRAPAPAVRPPSWPLLVAVPGEGGGQCNTVGCLTQQPPATIRNTGDLGINY